MIRVEEGNRIVAEFIKTSSSESMIRLIEYCRNNIMSKELIATLAHGLANSGEVFPKSDEERYDIPSTGGPGSLSTLLTPLILAANGKKVVKLGVPGRPAGGIDVLSQIKNYKISPDKKIMHDWIKSFPYIHFISNEVFAPLDIKLFNYRKAHDAVDFPALVVASILAKKISSGITVVGLDIRVSSFGNFGRTWTEARANAYLFNNVSSCLGMQSKCFISNGFSLPQPYIGRGEALLALYNIFKNRNVDSTLKKHIDHCNSMAISLSENTKVLSIETLENEFRANILNQGGVSESFDEISEEIEKSHIYEIKANYSGFLVVNSEAIRNSIVWVQSKIKGSVFADPCGVILKANQHQYVRESDVVCTYRCVKAFKDKFAKMLTEAFNYAPTINLKEELEII